MIKKLRHKLVLIIMLVVFLILLAIFFTLVFSTQRNSERMNERMLHQALNTRTLPHVEKPPAANNRTLPFEEGAPNMRLPVLVIEMDKNGAVSVISNQLHFIVANDIEPIVALALSGSENIGTLQGYQLRYLRSEPGFNLRIAFADISIEREILRTQILNSLFVGGIALALFFFLSLLLAHWAVRPIEVAWDRQKQFIANASHELKTPLTVILSNADMLMQDKPFQDEKNTRRIGHVYAETVRMKQLVEDMLTLARSDSIEKPMVYGLVDFSDIVKNAVLTHEAVIYDEEKIFSYKIKDALSVSGDMSRLQQVVHILLDNARKYSDKGARISVDLGKTEHNTLILTVFNESKLIPKDELENIFLRFYRCDEARSAYGSFGLGLSIAQNIVKEHKGKIWAERCEDIGNIFCVTLPVKTQKYS